MMIVSTINESVRMFQVTAVVMAAKEAAMAEVAMVVAVVAMVEEATVVVEVVMVVAAEVMEDREVGYLYSVAGEFLSLSLFLFFFSSPSFFFFFVVVCCVLLLLRASQMFWLTGVTWIGVLTPVQLASHFMLGNLWTGHHPQTVQPALVTLALLCCLYHFSGLDIGKSVTRLAESKKCWGTFSCTPLNWWELHLRWWWSNSSFRSWEQLKNEIIWLTG